MKMTIKTLLVLGLFAGFSSASYADNKWITPTQEELSMTSQPEVPGAPAVYLYREEITEDSLHMWSFYVRLKVLTEEGKKYGDIKLHFMKGGGGYDEFSGYSISDIQGRTIQPDGTIVPFTGKPYDKLIEQSSGMKLMSKVFSLPAVQVGSILEYRYTMRWDDNRFIHPSWYPQEDLFTRKAHYVWKPTSHDLIGHENGHESISHGIAWTPILPPGPKVTDTTLPGGQEILELTMTDIKPMPQEPYMPPIAGFSYKVIFYYTSYRSSDEYWKNEGKFWSSNLNKFIGPDSGVKQFVAKTVAPGDTSEQKLRKLYGEVMKLENTSYTRHRSRAETGKQIKNTDDVLAAGYGSDDQLTLLFIAMARAAGFKAYAMGVTNRSRRMFMPSYLSFDQLDDLIAIVNVDGKEQFFDPGERYMPYGHLEWMHTITQGLRQTDGGTELSRTPGEVYTFSSTARIGDIHLAEDGTVSGSVTLRFQGEPALNWRHRALRGDDESLRDELRKYLEHLLPQDVEVKVVSIQDLTNPDNPLKVAYSVKGRIGKTTSSRILFPADMFLTNAKPAFTSDRRETGIYFQYPEMMQDAMRLTYPASYSLESTPKETSTMYEKVMAYSMKSKQSDNSITVWRNLTYGTPYFEPKEYPQLKSFFTQFENADQDAIVLKAGTSTVSAQAPSN